MIPLERTLPDTRGEWCRVEYDKARFGGERTSVIICFHNEVCPMSEMTIMFFFPVNILSIYWLYLVIKDIRGAPGLGPLVKWGGEFSASDSDGMTRSMALGSIAIIPAELQFPKPSLDVKSRSKYARVFPLRKSSKILQIQTNIWPQTTAFANGIELF